VPTAALLPDPGLLPASGVRPGSVLRPASGAAERPQWTERHRLPAAHVSRARVSGTGLSGAGAGGAAAGAASAATTGAGQQARREGTARRAADELVQPAGRLAVHKGHSPSSGRLRLMTPDSRRRPTGMVIGSMIAIIFGTIFVL